MKIRHHTINHPKQLWEPVFQAVFLFSMPCSVALPKSHPTHPNKQIFFPSVLFVMYIHVNELSPSLHIHVTLQLLQTLATHLASLYQQSGLTVQQKAEFWVKLLDTLQHLVQNESVVHQETFFALQSRNSSKSLSSLSLVVSLCGCGWILFRLENLSFKELCLSRKASALRK